MDKESIASLVEALEGVSHSIDLFTFIFFVFVFISYFTIMYFAIKNKPETPDMFTFNINRADELYHSGKIDGLIDYAKTCLDTYPNDIHARYYLGLAYFYQKNYAEALSAFEEVIRINPGWKEEPLGPYLAEISEHMDSLDSSGQRH